MELITGFLAAKGLAIAGVGIAGLVLSFLIKKFVTQGALDEIGDGAEWLGHKVGVFVTLGLAKWKYTKKLWNSVLEPPLILIVEQLKRFFVGVIKGLRSDNPITK